MEWYLPVVVALVASAIVPSMSLPTQDSRNDKEGEYALPDHVAGMPLERDGDVNTKMDAELFLGSDKELVDDDDSPATVRKLLTDTFHHADKNADDHLGFWELRDWIHGKMEEHRADADRDLNPNFAHDFDTDSDGMMSWTEYTVRLRDHVRELLREDPSQKVVTDAKGHKLTMDEEVDYALEYTFQRDKKRFRYADLNGDEKLDHREYLYFVHPEYNKASLKSLAEDLLKKLDDNDDGVLSEQEFLAYYTSIMEQQYDVEMKNTEELIGRWRRTFRTVLDSNEDNEGDLTEFANFLDPTNDQHSMDEAAFLLNQADTDKDGMLSLDEVLRHSDLFAGSTLTDSSNRVHWDEL